MVGLGAKVLGPKQDMEIARQLTDGCLWVAEHTAQGIHPEILETVPCQNNLDCPWNEDVWMEKMHATHGTTTVEAAVEKLKELALPKGITIVTDRRYQLRPEVIESVFLLYRMTGNATYQDRAWNMFNSIIRHTRTDIAHAGLDDCTTPGIPPKQDRMESFWLAETLKYFFLIFDEPGHVSLDDYVFNTEAHP